MANDPKAAETVEVAYLKSNLFRVMHVDGAYGGVTPRGMIWCAVYNERGAIPRAGEVTISEEGTSERITDTRNGVVREVEAEFVIGLNEAAELARWLEEKVKLARAALGQLSNAN